jgi:mercuric ion transport protein
VRAAASEAVRTKLKSDTIITKNFWEKHTDKVGVVGVAFTALCCFGFPALLSILSAIGLGFLINDAVLLPLLVIFLLVTLLGLVLGMPKHHRAPAFILGIISAASVFIFIFVAFNKVLAGISAAGLVIASILNVLFSPLSHNIAHH